VTRKITIGLVNRMYRDTEPLQLGDLTMQRDWGNAGDYVNWMYLLLRDGLPGDYIIGSGENRSVEEFLFYVARALQLELSCRVNQKSKILEYFDEKTGIIYAFADSGKFQANRFSYGPANTEKLTSILGISTKTDFPKLAHEMISTEISRMKLS
jgi:GDPmannose 4,6-dehydratase